MPPSSSSVSANRVGPGPLPVHEHPGADSLFQLVDASEALVEEVDRSDLAAADRGGGRSDGVHHADSLPGEPIGSPAKLNHG